jgi:ATP-dependent Clp protease ATP-binding subunit ClpA
MKSQKDSFIAVDHIIASLIKDKRIDTILKNCGVTDKALQVAIDQTRGNKRVDTKNAEEGFEALKKYTTDFTQLARDGKLDPVIGREAIIARAIRVLSRRTKNNAVLLGEPGVGKTAVVEGLAHRINNDDVPVALQNSRLLSLDLTALVAGTSHRGEFEERLKSVLKEIEDSTIPIILFIDEMHLLAGAGAAGGSMDASNILKPMLARGALHCIGATTTAEYKKYIEKDSALERRFQVVQVPEPSVADAISILRGLKERYEVFHNLTITDSALVSAAQLASRYLTGRRLPDSAIDLIDEAAASVSVARDSQPEELDQLERAIKRLAVEVHALEREKDEASKERLAKAREEMANLEEQLQPLKAKFESEKARGAELQDARLKLDTLRAKAQDAERRGDLQTAADLTYYAIPELEKRIQRLETEKQQQDQLMKDEDSIIKDVVTDQEIAEVVSRWTNIPATKLKLSDKARLLGLEKHLAETVVGQPEAVKAVANAVRMARAGLSDPNQPPSFLFCGPSGTGKTLLTKALAEFLFDDKRAITRIDCSEYSEKHSAARLIGAPPGYVGYEEGGQLTEAIRRKPFSIVLFDEVEKASPDVLLVLLQLLDEGRITDGQGRLCDARNTIIIMTSNLGAHFLLEDSASTVKGKISKATREHVMSAIRGCFRPEFINRLSSITIFNKLTPGDIRKIVESRIKEVQDRILLNGKNVRLLLDDAAKDYLGAAGYSPQYGARPLNRLIQKEVLERLAVLMLRDQIRDGEDAIITMKGNKLLILANHLGEDGLIEHDMDDEMEDEDEIEVEELE